MTVLEMSNEEAIKYIRTWNPIHPLKQEAITKAIRALKENERGKHGHWVVLTNCSNSGVYCSECNVKMFDRYPMKKKFSQYCGHCGAHNDLQIEVI